MTGHTEMSCLVMMEQVLLELPIFIQGRRVLALIVLQFITTSFIFLLITVPMEQSSMYMMVQTLL